MEAIHLHLVEGWTYRRIMEKFGMTDRHRLKDWMQEMKRKDISVEKTAKEYPVECMDTVRSSCYIHGN